MYSVELILGRLRVRQKQQPACFRIQPHYRSLPPCYFPDSHEQLPIILVNPNDMGPTQTRTDVRAVNYYRKHLISILDMALLSSTFAVAPLSPDAESLGSPADERDAPEEWQHAHYRSGHDKNLSAQIETPKRLRDVAGTAGIRSTV